MMDLKCECETDGFCERYQRQMRGRCHDICRGINVDAGTAVMLRAFWTHEAEKKRKPKKIKPLPNARKILLRNHLNAGDNLAMTAAIYSLHRAHPGKFITCVDSSFPELFEGNPDVTPGNDGELIETHYPAIHESNERGITFIEAYCEHLGSSLGVHVPLMTNRPHVYNIYDVEKG